MPEKFKIPNSISIMEFSEEKHKESMVIFVCERGLTSKGLANYYRSLGIKAYSLEKGFEGYKNIMKEIS
jgi:thiamine biosynthesis protein ThiI